MQLYAALLLPAGAAEPDLAAALLAAAAPFPQIDPATLAVGRSRSGRLVHGRIGHPETLAAPRRPWAERAGSALLMDGFPVERSGRFPAHDAHALLEHWEDAAGEIEGLFTAVRLDLEADVIECMSDMLGLAPMYVRRTGGATLLANSVEVLRRLAPAEEVDPLGLASFVALGWPAEQRTLLSGIESLPGGGLHRFGPRGESREAWLTPATVLDGAAPGIDEVTERMLTAARAAVTAGAPVRSALSSGRDTRLLLALLLAAGAEDVHYYTSGTPGDRDIRVAEELARRYGLEHEILLQHAPASQDEWSATMSTFVARNDGLTSIESMNDHLDHDAARGRVELEFWGAGGEVGRRVKFVVLPLGGLTPGARHLWATQRALLRYRLGDGGGLVRPEGMAEIAAFQDRFVAERRAEGWPAHALYDAYFAFARVRYWAGRGVRRASAAADVYSPFMSRAYLHHGLRLTPGERWAEQPHRQIITALRPDVDTIGYELPWRPQRPRLAFPLHLAETGAKVGRRLARRQDQPFGPDLGPVWLEAGLPAHRELARSVPDSPLWSIIDRERHLALCDGPAAARAEVVGPLCRVVTALWWLHAPR